ncbi:hypothetical protein GCM10011316_10050 [Roseibium aquae]|uniref:DUF1761 domain-containing protein n=1 Tax=Roseibium aquae TaxID=1323746 RepID=A0A916TCF5_9HYPH|nr:DUF1761 domain-containing protein [Roseibium aquae]GGB39997.1 hypothetical protein GCM10011316_10050 [Roseibium aquae]
MMFDGINLLGALFGAIASFAFGAAWYGVLGKAWRAAAGLTPEQTRLTFPKLMLAFVCQFLMAFIFAGVIYHVDGTSIRAGVISGVLLWTGIILTTHIVNHRFQNRPWSLTLIDSGHWFGVLMIQGVVIGAVGSWPSTT